MPDFFERLGHILRSILADEDEPFVSSSPKFYDPDLQEAWEELEDYLNDGKTAKASNHKQQTKFREGSQERTDPHKLAREKLRADYETLKVPFGAPFNEVKASYKRLLQQFHPDRHAADPEKYKLATEITSKLNQAFQRIKEFEGKD